MNHYHIIKANMQKQDTDRYVFSIIKNSDFFKWIDSNILTSSNLNSIVYEEALKIPASSSFLSENSFEPIEIRSVEVLSVILQ